MSDVLITLQWYLVLTVIGIGFFPLTATIFSSFFDRGYAFSKIVGMCVLSYGIFVLGTFKIVPFSEPYIVGLFLLCAVINVVLLRSKIQFKTSKELISIVLVEELLFLTALVVWTFVRAHEPSINGLEKFMDYGFVNTILRSEYFPPVDMWFPPFPINYYYFGHLMTAVLTKISFLPSQYTYNLMVATLFAFCMTACFSIGYTAARWVKQSPVRSMVAGILSAVLVSLGGNTHMIYAFFTAYTPAENPVPFWQLTFNPLELFSNNGYWYPNATRFIPNTIHEFPLYSFVVSDLHGHVLDIPVVLVCVGVLLQIFVSKQYTWIYGVSLGFLLAIMYMTNVLDFGIYSVLSIAVISYLLYQKTRKKITKQTNNREKNDSSLIQFLTVYAKSIGVIIVSAVILIIPFSLNFKPFASGIGILCAPKVLTDMGSIGPLLFEANHCQRSEWWMLVTLYAFFYIFVSILFIHLWRNKKSRKSQIHIFMVLVTGIASLFIIIPEFAYIKDIYPDHYRANTMFKLTYQSFIMLGLVSSFVIATIVIPKKNILVSALTLVLLGIVLLYPRFAIFSYYNSLSTYEGIDGTQYLQDRYPDDYQAIQWINTTISGQPVILESQGDSYTDHARISSNTGLPTVLGWTVHQWLWRGTYDVPAPRIVDVQTLYETADIQTAKTLIKKYNIEYVYVGNLEREKYPNLIESKFLSLGSIIFQHNSVRIYKIHY